ncbi:MAG: family 10 glycosylhydrolase [Armatimonadetes bacterium]|nr:family 10 glycosylhydrolase [Armatimonadota bacterium]
MTTLLLACGMLTLTAEPEQRAVWVNYRHFQTPEAVAQTVAKVSAAHLNSVYPLIWYNGGQAWYKSSLSPLAKDVPVGFDPLAALIEQAHAKGIAVHAWFVNGNYGAGRPGFVFDKHPDWALQEGPGPSERWYDLGRPEVRAFERDVMLDCLRNYDLDGLHFDYIRFDGRGMCYCSACQTEVQKRYGLPPVSPTDPRFPVGLQLSGNPLDQPTTAHVVATFDNGKPAITLNQLDTGETILLNWQATRAGQPAVNLFARRVLERFGAERKVVQLRCVDTTAKYGLQSQSAGLAWLRALGAKPTAVTDQQLGEVSAGAIVVLDGQYRIPATTAAWLARHVSAGGRALFIDGPVSAISDPELQRVLGLRRTAPFFSEFRVIQPAAGQELLPVGPPLDQETERRRAGCWTTFRTDSVTDLVRQVYYGTKALKPNAQVSAAVFADRSAADGVCQDWYGWLKEGILDYALPMAYTLDNAVLKRQLDEWQAFDPTMARIYPGLSLYLRQGDRTSTRPVDLVASQQELCKSYKARGMCYFELSYLDEALTTAWAGGLYAEAAAPFYPPAR